MELARLVEVVDRVRATARKTEKVGLLADFLRQTQDKETELTALCTDILANSWYANQVIKRALIETDGLTVRDAYALDLFKNEGLAPDGRVLAHTFVPKFPDALREQTQNLNDRSSITWSCQFRRC